MFNQKELNRMIFPLIVEQSLAVFMSMADTMMVSSCSGSAVAAVSLVEGFHVLIVQLFFALSIGGSIVMSQTMGKEDYKKTAQVAQQLIVSVTVLACFLSVVVVSNADVILRLSFGHLSADVYANAKTYLVIMSIGYPFYALFYAGGAIFRSMGNTKLSLQCSSLMNVLNVVGNAVLIYGFHMAVKGAAIATVGAMAIGALLMIGGLLYVDHTVKVRFNHFRFDFSIIKSIFIVGIPSGIENTMFHGGRLIISRIIATLGEVAISANAIAGSISNMSSIPQAAIGLVMIPVVGRCIGGNKLSEAKSYTMKLMGQSIVYLTALNGLMILGSQWLVRLYQPSTATFDIAWPLLSVYCALAMILLSPCFALPNALRSGGDSKWVMMISIVSMWLVRVCCSYVFVQWFHWGLTGIWAAMFADWLFRATAYIVRFFSMKWIKKVSLLKSET